MCVCNQFRNPGTLKKEKECVFVCVCVRENKDETADKEKRNDEQWRRRENKDFQLLGIIVENGTVTQQ